MYMNFSLVATIADTAIRIFVKIKLNKPSLAKFNTKVTVSAAGI